VIKSAGGKEIVFVCIVAAPEGVAKLQKAHPNVAIYAGAIDRVLNTNKYILPGLGDFGDRLYGT
jgi:uracil phosphoribosyltransferase